MATKKATSKKTAPTKAVYAARIKVMGRTFEAKGGTVSEAINNLAPGNMARGRGILVVSGPNGSRERILMPAMTMRLFSTRGLVRDILLKNISSLFA